MISFSLLGCSTNSEKGVQREEAVANTEGFIEPDSSDWVQYIVPVREYLYYRTNAVLQDNIDVLWKRYPHLKINIDRKTGVNIEKFEVQSLNESFHLIDANFSVEGWERIKIKETNDNQAIVLVHGGIGYLREDFEESGGEILIKLFLEREDDQWIVVKTDEYLLHEYKEWLKNK